MSKLHDSTPRPLSRRLFLQKTALAGAGAVFALKAYRQAISGNTSLATIAHGAPDNREEQVSLDSADPDYALARPSVNGQLHVNGTFLVDQDGRPVRLRGISTHGLAWFGEYVNQECFQDFSAWGANVVRLAMYTHEWGGYCTGGDQAALKQLIHTGVEAAINANMYVVIDWHVLQECDPNVYIDDALGFWDEISRTYAGCPNVLYEICNEPNGDTTWDQVKSYAQAILPVIRDNDSRTVVLVGTPQWSQRVDLAAADPITEYGNLMYTLHFYAATHKEDLRQNLKNAHDAGLPIFVSEYGICDASGNGALDIDSANKWVTLMDSLGISYICWNLSNKDESSSLLLPGCTKTSGFTQDDLSASGQWLVNMLSGATPDLAHIPGQNKDDAQSAPEDQNDPDAQNNPSQNQSDTNNASASQHSNSAEPLTAAVTEQTPGLTCTISLRQTWDESDKTAYLYDLTLTNTSDTNLDSWDLLISFSQAIELRDYWCTAIDAAHDTLRLSPAEFNASVPSGSTVTDIGFIVLVQRT